MVRYIQNISHEGEYELKSNSIGQIATDLKNKDHGLADPREIQQATEKEYLDNLIWAIHHAQKKIDCSNIADHDMCKSRDAFDRDFYIVALLKKEKLLDNVLRNYFIPTISCPTPHFDQTVYKYDSKKENIEHLWTIPDEETSLIFLENKDKIVPEEQQLLSYILKYFNGDLFKLCKRLNGETQFAGSALKGKELWQ